LLPPKKFSARPTTDFAKEGLFNVIENFFNIEELYVLDLFSGTGSISYEFASRACKKIDLVELNTKHYLFIEKMVKNLEFSQITAIKGNAFIYMGICNTSYDIVFADPPYDMEEIESIPDLAFKNKLVKPKGWLIIEHPGNISFTDNKYFFNLKKYGSVNFSFLRYKEKS